MRRAFWRLSAGCQNNIHASGQRQTLGCGCFRFMVCKVDRCGSRFHKGPSIKYVTRKGEGGGGVSVSVTMHTLSIPSYGMGGGGGP